MYVHEYGDKNLPKWLMLHPLGLTGENIYNMCRDYLSWDYCILSPDQGGHGSSGPYISLDDEMSTLTGYLLERGYTDLLVVSSSSMGTIAAYEMLKDDRFHIENVWFESGLFKKNAPIVEIAMRRMFFKMLDDFQKDPESLSERHVKLYGEEYAKVMRDNFLRLTRTDIARISETFTHRRMVSLPEDVQKKIHLDWGDEDILERLSRRDIPRWFPESEVTVRKGYGHCSYMAYHIAEYMAEIERFIHS